MTLCYNCMTRLSDQKLHTCPRCGQPLQPAAVEPDVLLPGTVLQGRFILGRLLGFGGFGNTYIGWNQILACRVAVKEFFPRSMSARGQDRKTISVSGETMQARYRQSLRSFLEEARRLAELNDVPGIPDIYSYFEENGTGYIVMEYLEGVTVKTLMKDSGGRLSYEFSRQIILSVLYLLKEVHRRGILHRDIAPDNIMITDDGIVELIDFGVSKRSMSDMADPVLILKAGYSPLEQYSRGAAQGVYTDLYSVAATFYHMVTGVKPPGAMDRIHADTLLPLTAYGVGCTSQAEMAVMMCLYLKPEHRLANVEEFIMALDGGNFRPVTEWKPPMPAGDGKRAEKRNGEFPAWAKVLVAGLLCVALAGGAYILLSPNRGEKVEGEAADSKEEPALNIIGMTEGEAEETLKSKGIKYELGREIIFDPDVKNGSEILSQEPAAGTVPEKGTVTAEIILSSEKCLYRDLLEEEEVNSLCEKFGIDVQKVSASEEKDADDPEKTYGRLYSVILADGRVLKPKDLKSKDIMTLSDIQSVTYYVSPYFYVKKLENYKGKNIGKIKFHKYTEKKGKKVKAGTGRPPCSYTYFSFEEERGCIVSQRKAKGKSYRSDRDNGSLFDVVKEKISWKGKKADELISELEDRGFKKDKLVVKGNGTEIGEIKVSGKGGKKFFTARDRITITRKKQEARPQAAKPSGKKNKEITSGDGNGSWGMSGDGNGDWN